MVTYSNTLYLGKGEQSEQKIRLQYANRHGLIAGATGTGKTVTLQGLAEGFSQAGVPVFIADVKGDLSGLAASGQPKQALTQRAEAIGFSIDYQAFPVIFWDIFGKKGHPVRTTISEMGPLLLARLLNLNDTQEGVLNIVFAMADDEGLLLLDLEDLRAMLTYVADNASDISKTYGNISTASVGAVQRALLVLEQQGGETFFGEPALNIHDFMRLAPNGMGAINILAADTLMETPKLYASFMLWLLSELFEDLPEVGDMDKPKLVFFFDEAHLLFDEAPKILVDKIEQLVKLIRSKGVGVYFITQNPADIPDGVLAQLGNRVQHALRAYTPKEQKGVKAAAESFRVNPAFDTQEAITQLGIGEALVSVLDEKSVPTVVERTLIRPPYSYVGAIEDAVRISVIAGSPVAGMYDQEINRESAYEMLMQRVEDPVSQAQKANDAGGIWGTAAKVMNVASGGGGSMAASSHDVSIDANSQPHRRSMPSRQTTRSQRKGNQSDSFATTVAKSVARSVGSQVGRQIVRGIMRSMLK